MSTPERRISTFYAFCSLIVPGLGQLLQKRIAAAIGFFTLFLVSGFLPVLIVSLLFMDRFSYQPFRIHLLHILTFGGLYLVFLLAIFWSVLDAARQPVEKPVEISDEKSKPHSRFPIIEILVSIAIVGILVALLWPAVPAAREPARRMMCSNNMKQIALAFHNYHDEYGSFPPVYTVDETGKPLHSWRVLILPYMEERALYEEIRLDEPWDSEHNRQFHSVAPKIFQCPSAGSLRETPSVPAPAGCFYSVIDGPEVAFFGSQTRSMPEKSSETIFLVERRTPVLWMNPTSEMTFDTACKGVNVDAMGISSYHVEGANVAMADGSVQFLSSNIDCETLRKILMSQKTTQE